MTMEKRELLEKTFQTFVEVCFSSRNMGLLREIVVADVVGIGSAMDEKIFGLDELITLLNRQKEQSAGFEMRWELNTLNTHISDEENSAIYTCEAKLFVTVDTIPVEIDLRLSTVLEYRENKWQVVHWHGSKPEAVESEKDTWGIENWKEKAAELEKQVAERTADLLVKNHELAIEAALERVRTVAMGMKKPEEMLDVCRVIAAQLQQFGVAQIRNVQTAIINENIGQYICYQFFPTYDQTVIEDTQYHKSPVEHEMVRQMLACCDGHFIGCLEGEELEAFRLHRKKEKQFPDTLLDEASEISYAFLSIGEGGLGLSLYGAMQDEVLALFKRFHQVFNLAYQRFRDIQLAEAQAREARIEAALEKVRSRTMAMHKSEELKDVIQVVYEQFVQLDIPAEHTGFLMDYKSRDDFHSWIADKFGTPAQVTIPYFDCIYYNRFNEAKKQGIDSFAVTLTREEKNRFYEDLFKHVTGFPEESKRIIFSHPGFTISTVLLENVALYIENFTGIPFTDEENAILMRFGRVFQQTYTRFLDLQKAEAQAREAQIEASLERVRAATAAMHQTEELLNVIEVVSNELDKLGLFFTHVNFRMNEGERDWDLWSHFRWLGKPMRWQVKYIDHPFFNKSCNNPEEVIVQQIFSKEEKDSIEKYLIEQGAILIPEPAHEREIVQQYLDEGIGFAWSVYRIRNISLAVANHKGILYKEEQNNIIKRFTQVFYQTYTRFLDLQKAEAQAREAQIEAALERVRSRSMAMHDSGELGEVAKTMFNQMKLLGGELFAFGIVLCDKDKNVVEQWHGLGEGDMMTPFQVPVDLDHIHRYRYDQWKAGVELFSIEIPTDYIARHFELMFALPSVKMVMDDLKTKGIELVHPPWEIDYGASFRYGYLLVSSLKPYAEEKIFPRFAKVFEQTYTRFLDLQKAEAQAREAQIEAALERVRTKTMAMHNSNDVGDTVLTMFDELIKLGAEANRCGIIIIDKTKQMEVWTAGIEKDSGVNLIMGKLDMTIHPLLEEVHAAWKSRKDTFEYRLAGDNLVSYYKAINDSRYYPKQFDLETLPAQQSHTDFFFAEGALFVFSPAPIGAENTRIFKRFAGLFGQTYRRYLDLQQAENQAREATIQASLESVRARAMAMQNSSDISATIQVVFSELQKLGIQSFRSGVGLITKETRMMKYYSSGNYGNETNNQLVLESMLDGHDFLLTVYDRWLKQEDYFPVLEGNDLVSFYDTLNVAIPASISKNDNYQQYGYCLPFTAGIFYGWSEHPFYDEETEILQRFRSIVDLTFRRYLELQKAEANALEAIRSASLDRVRADIASMRTIADLDRITPLIWKELTTLGIPFIRCGVFIMDEEKQEVQSFLSTPDGKSIASFRLPYFATEQSKQIVAHWQLKKLFRDHMDEMAFAEYAKNLVMQGAVASDEKYVTENRPKDLYLHFTPFLQGMLYVGNNDPLKDEELQLVQNLADAFATAYARYEDFNKLDVAKREVDNALQELKMAQDQLVQAEKLASLGQLTAGIAHEIKNPLNFINNFSEVSVELIEEVLAELDQAGLGETRDEIKEILGSVRSNLNIIHQHGSRADGIVKSMLMHSRSGSGRKVPADLNAMVRENVNLAFHAMRATKDPMVLETVLKLDDSVGEVSLIIEDFSRVILNLCNNAIDAMREKLDKFKMHDTVNGTAVSGNGKGYLPRLTVMTSRLGNQVIMEIEDNGTGIPAEIRDKVLQPFFTTKKGTLGTGLGLSITHDIIKAHGGTLEIETDTGKFTKFIITIT